MPPWANDPAPPGTRRLVAQPAPTRRPNPPSHRRITEYFNHKMKPQNGIKRDSSAIINDDTKKRCLSKNGVTNDLEKYISYLSQTLSPKVMLDVDKQSDATKRPVTQTCDTSFKPASNTFVNGAADATRLKGGKESNYANNFVEKRHETDTFNKNKFIEGPYNGATDLKRKKSNVKFTNDPSANIVSSKPTTSVPKLKVPIPHAHIAFRIAPAIDLPKILAKADSTRMNEVVSSTTKLDSRMNGVTCGSNNLSLNSGNKTTLKNRELSKKSTQAVKRTNRKSSACIANSKNLTWSKANNLKQVQLQNKVFSKSVQEPTNHTVPEVNTTPKVNVPNGVRQVSMTVNGNLNNIPTPVTNFQNCHQLNLSQPCNGTVTSNNLTSFVAVPSNVMLTTLRIPQNGLPAQALGQQNGLAAAFNRPNVNVSSPTKLNGSFVFPLMQNLNGTVVQIPNFVLPQTPQLTAQRQDHLQNQQTAQFLINGTLLKLANTIPAAYTNHSKPGPVTSQPIPMMNKNVPGMQAVGMTVQPKPNFAVNLSHPMLMPQPGFIVTSVPNMNVKETWSYTGTNTVTSSQTTCSNPIVQHHTPLMANYTAQTLHTSSIPIAPVKPPDNPIQGTEPPSSTVVEPDISDSVNRKGDVPWLSKTINNNIVTFDSNKFSSRPFAQLSSCSEKIEIKTTEKILNTTHLEISDVFKSSTTSENLKKVEEVARREETIFTQITVLKDVSSTVQSTLIEANYSGATTESSESGIGTDKSIDSPSDSQASKECDEDSSLSLSVSISSVEVENSQKSPILKQPKILRFPPKITKPGSGKRKSSTNSAIVVCLWENCKKEFENDIDLLSHLQSDHVETQAGKENYVCLWEQCKVRGKPSCSRLWLERHTLSHGGNKPFKCIVDGCDRRFSTQILLERHVNNHFNEATPSTNGSKKTTDSSSKLIRRNGKKLRYRRQPWSARMFDFFDAGMMEGLAWRLLRATRWRLGGSCPLREPAGRHTLTLHAALAATRYNAAAARTEALLTYYPPDVIDDEWVPESEVKRVKRVEICELPAHTKVMLYEHFCNSYRKTPSPPPPPRKTPAVPSQPARLLPARQCTSSRLLNNLLAKKKSEVKNDCSSTNIPMIYVEEDKGEKIEVSGAKKRKMGRRYGGNSFWPCGR